MNGNGGSWLENRRTTTKNWQIYLLEEYKLTTQGARKEKRKKKQNERKHIPLDTRTHTQKKTNKQECRVKQNSIFL